MCMVCCCCVCIIISVTVAARCSFKSNVGRNSSENFSIDKLINIINKIMY